MDWKPFQEIEAKGGLHIKNESLRDLLYISLDRAAQCVRWSHDISDLLPQARKEGAKPSACLDSVAALASSYLIPDHREVYQDVYFLSIGDGARIVCRPDPEVEITHNFPYLREKCRENSVWSIDTLIQCLCRSLEAQGVKNNPGTLLLLSGGKDSVPVAIALAEMGYDQVQTVTYAYGSGTDGKIAARIAKDLGLRHTSVDVRSDQTDQIARTFFEASPLPNVDPALFAYLSVMHQFGPECVLDGVGSDMFVGHLPPQNELRKQRWTLGKFRNGWLPQKFLPFNSKYNFLTLTPVEIGIGSWGIRQTDLQSLCSWEVGSVAEKWREYNADYREMHPMDFRAYTKGRLQDLYTCMGKGRLASKAFGARVAFPWIDHEVTSYYFHLPEVEKYSLADGLNKLPLRSYLESRFPIDKLVSEKRSFRFNAEDFLVENYDLVKGEIARCPLWTKKVESLQNQFMATAVQDRWPIARLLLTLYQLSGWYNAQIGGGR